MAPPSRKQQIAAVVKFLDSDRNQERSLEEIATEIVDGYHEMLLGAVKKPATPLRTGMLLKSPYDGKVRRVAWQGSLSDGGKVWVVHESSQYGWLGPSSPPTWEYCEEFRPKRRTEVDGKGKMVEMTDLEIQDVWDNPDWSVGDRVSQRQRQHVYEVIAVAPLSVLMRNTVTGVLTADSNRNLRVYYKKEEKW